MKMPRSIGWLVTTIAAVAFVGLSLFTGSGVVGVAHAAPSSRTAANVAAYGVPHEMSKFILPETSLDGPALWTQRGPSAPIGALAVLAWTGTDSRLNFEFTNDAVSFFGKTTLNETSFVRPAVVRGAGEGGYVAPVAVAWTGTDSGHHLNVLYVVPGSASLKLTLWQDNSFTSPALEWLDGTTLLLAWAGTDGSHALNILPVSVTSHGLVAGTKTTLWTYHSLGQPTIIYDYSVLPVQPRIFLCWSDMTSRRVTWATSPDAVTWTQQATFSEWSGSGPSMMGLNEQLAHMPAYWLGWTGVDLSHHVNVLYALDDSVWTTNTVKAILPETAIGGTAVGFFLSTRDQQMLVAWTGTDTLHHLNIAWIAV